MSRFEQRALQFRDEHLQLFLEMDTQIQYVDALRADAAYQRANHDSHENPNSELFGQGYHEILPPSHVEVYTETQDILDRALKYQANHDKTKDRYDKNIQKARAHVQKHLPKYIAMAQADMQTRHKVEVE